LSTNSTFAIVMTMLAVADSTTISVG